MTTATVDSQRGGVVLLLALSGFASSANLRMLDAALPRIAAEFGVSVGQASMVTTAYALSYGLLQIFFGVIGDRVGKYRVVMFLCAMSCMATFANTLTDSLPQLILARFAAGAAASAIIPIALAWIGDMVPIEQRQQVLARYMSGSILGLLFGQIIGGLVTQYADWRWGPAAISLVYLLVAVALFWVARVSPWVMQSASDAATRLSPKKVLIRILGAPWPRQVLLAVSIEGLAIFGATTFIGVHLNQKFGADFAVIGIILAFYAIGGILYSWGISRLLPRVGRSRLFLILSIVAITGLVFLAASPVLWTAPIAVTLVGLGASGMHNTLQTHATQLLPEARATGFAFFATCFFLSQSLGVALAGPIVDGFGTDYVFYLGAGLVIGLALQYSRRLSGATPASVPDL